MSVMLMRLPVARAAPEERILAVEFRATWDAVSWNDLYGE